MQLARSAPLWVPQEQVGREETTGFVPVDSSWIAGLKYTPQRGSEMVVKKGGKAYSYPGLNMRMFRRWVAAKSKGKWWWRNIGYPMQNSRWTGEVHPIFRNGVDGPIQMKPFSMLPLEEVMQWMRKHVHPQVTPEHLAAISGWLPGTHLSVNESQYPHELDLHAASPNGEYRVSRQLASKFENNGVPYLTNYSMAISPGNHPYVGASGPVYLRQIRAAFELGIPKVNFHATYGRNSYTGGLHWPMMGANGFLPEDMVRSVPPEILNDANTRSQGRLLQAKPDFKTFEDFFTSPAAREWYASNPVSHDAFIETHPGSYSRAAIERHVMEHATKHGQMPPLPDAQMPKMPLHLSHISRYHPKIAHLLATGSLHPDLFDSYWEN